MGSMASQITSLTIIYSTVYSDADQRKHQSLASLAFVRGIHRWSVNSPHKWPATRKRFPFDDVIMMGSTYRLRYITYIGYKPTSMGLIYRWSISFVEQLDISRVWIVMYQCSAEGHRIWYSSTTQRNIGNNEVMRRNCYGPQYRVTTQMLYRTVSRTIFASQFKFDEQFALLLP